MNSFDYHTDCLFCKIAHGDIPSTIIFEDTDIIAFHDISPKAPTHLLIIPKKHISTINDIDDTHDLLLVGKLITVAKQLAAKQGFAQDGYRLVMNCNPHGGQEVYHIHLHLLGGRQMCWPPG